MRKSKNIGQPKDALYLRGKIEELVNWGLEELKKIPIENHEDYKKLKDQKIPYNVKAEIFELLFKTTKDTMDDERRFDDISEKYTRNIENFRKAEKTKEDLRHHVNDVIKVFEPQIQHDKREKKERQQEKKERHNMKLEDNQQSIKEQGNKKRKPEEQQHDEHHDQKMDGIGLKKQNQWINHVKEFAKKQGISYSKAMKDANCKSSYKKKNYNFTHISQSPLSPPF